MRIAVTGATGFIGRHVVARLRAAGDEVDALARATSKDWKTALLREHGARIVPGDVQDPGSLERAFATADAVVHAAALVRLGKVDEVAMHATNVVGTENVLEAARGAGVRKVLHVSSIAALGVLDDGDANETTVHSGVYGSPYERSKHLASLAATRYAAAGLPVVQALPSVVFGRNDPNFGVFFKAYVRRRIPVLPAPETVISLVHVEDLARGIELALRHGPTGDRFLFTQRNLTLGALFARLEEATGIPAPRLRIPTGPARALVRTAAALSTVTPWRGWLRPTSGDLLGRRRSFSNRHAVEALGWDPGDFDGRLTDTARYYAAKHGPGPVRERLRHMLDPPTARPAA